MQDGAKQAERLLDRYLSDGIPFPETIAMVLWGTDNLKTEGAPIAQALALMGAAPVRQLWPPRRRDADPARKARPSARRRGDSLSGIFRDLLPLQIKLLAEAAFLAASAGAARTAISCASTRSHFVGRRTAATLRALRCGLRRRQRRLWLQRRRSRRERRLGGRGRIAETYTRRKGFAYGAHGAPVQQPELLRASASVDLAYQNLDSVELSVTTVDNYFDTLGGISSAVKRAKGTCRAGLYRRPDKGEGVVRTLNDSRAGNPHPHAQSEMVRKHAEARLRGRAPDRDPRDQHHWLVGHHWSGRALDLSSV